jgi:hypothetical protein
MNERKIVDAHLSTVSHAAELPDVIRNYNLWLKIANFVGAGPYDEPDWIGGRLHFRADY